MALVSASNIIRSISVFHITLAFYFLTSPITITDHNLVFVMGQAMKLPHVRAFDVQSAPLSFLAVVLGMVGVSDLVSISGPEEIAMYHWGAQAPIRLTMFFAIAFYSFAFSANSPLMASGTYTPSMWGEGLKNRLIFSWAFVEMSAWFWALLTLREERRDMATRIAEKRAAQEDMM
ncbi:MAG: hypothetical protein M1818_001727 [Claussenomyces sp. TS43310]|nr:MAG: hypothetical protein M1818_001727 [Claussenomyces sp. TS43310]